MNIAHLIVAGLKEFKNNLVTKILWSSYFLLFHKNLVIYGNEVEAWLKHCRATKLK